jgi:hypothetical protein
LLIHRLHAYAAKVKAEAAHHEVGLAVTAQRMRGERGVFLTPQTNLLGLLSPSPRLSDP